MSEMVLIFREGLQAFRVGVSRAKNPRDFRGQAGCGPQEASEWWRGWDRAAWEHGVQNQPNTALGDAPGGEGE